MKKYRLMVVGPKKRNGDGYHTLEIVAAKISMVEVMDTFGRERFISLKGNYDTDRPNGWYLDGLRVVSFHPMSFAIERV